MLNILCTELELIGGNQLSKKLQLWSAWGVLVRQCVK